MISFVLRLYHFLHPLGKKRRPGLCLFLLVSLTSTSVIFSANAQSTAERAAIEQVNGLLTRAHRASGSLSGLQSLISEYFALGTWTNATLGQAAGQLSDEQRSRVRNLMPSYIAKQYFTQFGGSGSTAGSVENARTVRGDVLVTSKIPGRNRTFTVIWRMRVINGRPQVIDYLTGGISGVVLRRSEFGETIKRSGGDGLIAFMEQFIAS